MSTSRLTNGKNHSSHLNRVAIIGCDNVGVTNAYSLLMSGAVEELVLIDKDNEKLLGEVTSLLRSVPLNKPWQVWAGGYEDAADADIAIIAAGVGANPGETKLELLGRNVSIIRETIQKLKAANFKGIILMMTNPVDVLAQVALEESGFPAKKVIGSGTVLNTERLQAIFGSEIGFESRSYQTCVTAEDENLEVATWCAARFGSMPLVDFCDPNCPGFPAMLERVRSVAPEDILHKGFTPVAVGSCVSRICEAILRDERAILPVSAMTDGEYGIEGVYLSLPCVVSCLGAEQIVELPLSGAEQKDLHETADLLKKTFRELKNKQAAAAGK
jgi:L-lactate dehydrogenase